jgi:hypothetical protein
MKLVVCVILKYKGLSGKGLYTAKLVLQTPGFDKNLIVLVYSEDMASDLVFVCRSYVIKARM